MLHLELFLASVKKKKTTISRVKGYRKLPKNDKEELKKFQKFLKLLDKRQAEITEEVYQEIYGK